MPRLSFIVFVAGIVIVEALRYMVSAPRPADAQGLVEPDEMMRSFPARGVFLFTLSSMLLQFALWSGLIRPRAALLASANLIALMLFVAISQLALGLHYITDVLAGLVGGATLALLATRFFPDSEFVPRSGPVAAPVTANEVHDDVTGDSIKAS